MTKKRKHEQLNGEESIETTAALDVHNYYRYFREELERREIKNGSLIYDSTTDENDDEDEYYEWMSYDYPAQNEQELDIQVHVDVFNVVLSAGPLSIEIANVDQESDMHHHAIYLVDLVQLFLNGQFAVVVTYREKDSLWQAAELVYVANGVEKTIAAVPHYSHIRSSLKAMTLRNHLNYPVLTLDNNKLLQPKKVNNHELIGRQIDLVSPTPLSHKLYSAHDIDITVQNMGGESGEAIWELFYRRIDFWIVCLAIGVPAVWVLNIMPDNLWWLNIIVGFVSMLLLMFTTSLLLTHRQNVVDSGKVPFTERLEEVINYRLISAFWALNIIATLFFVPVWTTRENPQFLQSALQLPQLLGPLLLSCFVIFSAMVLVRPSSRIKKITRTILMTLGYTGILFCNFVLLYGGEDAPAPPDYTVYIITVLPLAIIFWYVCDCFRPVRKERELRW